MVNDAGIYSGQPNTILERYEKENENEDSKETSSNQSTREAEYRALGNVVRTLM